MRVDYLYKRYVKLDAEPFGSKIQGKMRLIAEKSGSLCSIATINAVGWR